MFTKVMLVVIFMTGDAGGYTDVVSLFADKRACEEAKADLITMMKTSLPKDTLYFATCVTPRPIRSTGV